MVLRSALITGSARGIGREIARQLATDGLNVALNDLPSSRDLLEDLQKQINLENPKQKCIIVTADVTQENQVQTMFDGVVKELGGIDVMVANAGTCFAKSLVDTSPQEFDRIFSVNVRATYFCLRAAARIMIAQGRGGRIVAASSLSGQRGVAFFSAYSASKFAIKGLTQSLALEVGRHGITVNAYAPGAIDTPLLREVGSQFAEVTKGTDINTAHGSALGGMGDPSDVAGVVSFLVSDKARFITGQSISCDGGNF